MTIIEQLSTLPEPYRTQALNNHTPEFRHPDKAQCETLADALLFAFRWNHTPEGGTYWNAVYSSVVNG